MADGDNGPKAAQGDITKWMENMSSELKALKTENATLQATSERQAREMREEMDAKALKALHDTKKAERERGRMTRDSGARPDQIGVYSQMDIIEDILIQLTELNEYLIAPNSIMSFSAAGVEKSLRGLPITAGDLVEQPIVACANGKLLLACLEEARGSGLNGSRTWRL